VCEYFRYSALDATRLINLVTELFHCENCDSELVEESDKFAVAAPADVADGEDNARRRRREKLKDLLEKLDVRFHSVLFLTRIPLGTLLGCRFAVPRNFALLRTVHRDWIVVVAFCRVVRYCYCCYFILRV